MSDLINRADAIESVVCHIWHMPNGVYRQFNCENVVREVVEDAIKRLPSAEAVSREEYEEVKAYMDTLVDAFIEDGGELAESVKVVRCKDCKWWSGSANTSHNNHLCKRALDQNVEYWTRGDDYCSYGERKGGDTE